MDRRQLVIVGGGPAGLSTALHLREYAPSIADGTVVLEKAVYPRDKYCAGAIAARGLRRLERVGIDLEALGVAAVPVSRLSLRLTGGDVAVPQPGLGAVVRRLEFDHALARATARRGIEVREGAEVTGIDVDAGGVRVHVAGQGTISARAVVGADGVAGIVRRAAGLSRGTLRAQAVEVDTEPAPSDPPRDCLHFDLGNPDLAGYAWDFPTRVGDRDLVCRGVYLIVDRAHRPVREWLARHLDSRGIDIAGCRVKHFAERGFEMGAAVSRPRVLLVGEAAGIDIATGEGIAQAIAFGELAARTLAGAFRDDEFGFGDWLSRVRSEGVGKRMILRHLAYRVFFGSDRPTVEKLTLASPQLLAVAARDFAGVPWGPSDAASGLLRLLPRLLAHPRMFGRSMAEIAALRAPG